MKLLNLKHKLILILFICFLSNSAIAKCSKEDINYYLEKGFTTEQVTALCSGEGMTSLKEDVYKSYSEEYADEEDEVDYLKKLEVLDDKYILSDQTIKKMYLKVREIKNPNAGFIRGLIR